MVRISKEERTKHTAYRELEDLASEMNYAIDAVVVEGSHDKKTFKLLGFKKPILMCSKLSNNQLTDIAAKKFSKVVILTDFDEEGIRLNKSLSKLFEKRGIKVDNFFRRKFYKLLKELRMSTIESIYRIKLELFS